MDRPRRSLPKPNYYDSSEHEQLQTPSMNHSAGDSSSAEAKMRNRHKEEAAEMARLNNEIASFKSDTAVSAQLNREIEEPVGYIKVLKETNFDLMVVRDGHCQTARKMQKSIDDLKTETKALKSRLEDLRKENNGLIQDASYEKGKRVQAKETLQEYLAAQKAIAEKFGARLV